MGSWKESMTADGVESMKLVDITCHQIAQLVNMTPTRTPIYLKSK